MNRLKTGMAFLLMGCALWVCGCGGSGDDPDDKPDMIIDEPTDGDGSSPSFQNDILPILTQRCAVPGCHVAGGPRGIDVRDYAAVLRGGQRGAIVIAGNAAGSELVNQIVTGKMPPGGPPLDAAQIQLITDWINDGAKNN